MSYETREAWLVAFTDAARPHFIAAGAAIPTAVRSSVGFPSTGSKGKRIGECWGMVASTDGHFEIFLHPSLETAARVADVLTHELVHAAVGLDAKHGPTFKRVAMALGLTGKMTATVAGPNWKAWANPVLAALGPFPAAPMTDLTNGRKKQAARMVKAVCGDCGFTFRAAAKWLDTDLICPSRDCGGAVTVD